MKWLFWSTLNDFLVVVSLKRHGSQNCASLLRRLLTTINGRRGDADLGPVTDRTGRVEGCPVTASSRGVRGRHSTSDIPVTPTPLAPSFHHGTGEAGSSTQPPAVLFRSRPPLHPHQSHTPVSYEPYGSIYLHSHHTDTVYDPYLQAPTVVRPRIPYLSVFQEPILYDGSQARQIGVEFFYQMLGATRQDSSCSTHGYSHADYGVSSSDHYVPGLAYRVPEGDRVFGKEQERVRILHIQGKSDERGDDDDGDGGDGEGGDGDGDGGDDDHDDGDGDGDEEQPVYVASVAPASGSDGRPCHGKRKGLTGSLMSVMSKFAGSHNKRPDVVHAVPATTQKRKKVKPSDMEQTEAAEGRPVDPKLIPTPMLHCCRHLLRGGSPTRTASTCPGVHDVELILGVPAYGVVVDHRLSRDQLLRAVQQDLGLGLTGGLGFNALQLHAVATSRQTSQSHQVRAACYL
ncbi:hypothetical protein M9H77_27505 [Catharanthus roseus]|uniref:Uncharacterized protein n=1 Tax=Catharanthus roseus TaxID=4058 RepID=A0ACC0AFD8_CATRO|nr:hypothetical protein M9H77_27505 [Catharanthus roseus]